MSFVTQITTFDTFGMQQCMGLILTPMAFHTVYASPPYPGVLIDESGNEVAQVAVLLLGVA